MTIKREAAWLAACAVAATIFCWLAPEYGFSPVPFFTAVLYLSTVTIRFLVRLIR